MVFIPLAVLVLEPKSAIVLCAGLNVFANIFLLKVDRKSIPLTYWLPPAVFMTVATILGALTLKIVPDEVFGIALGIVIACLGVWFILGRPVGSRDSLTEIVPSVSTLMDKLVAALAGFCGGCFGINGPPLILQFGQKFEKEALRKVLLLIFLPASFLQFGTYLLVDLVSWDLATLVAIGIPSLLFGTYLGNQVFRRLSIKCFNWTVGSLLLIMGGKLILAAWL